MNVVFEMDIFRQFIVIENERSTDFENIDFKSDKLLCYYLQRCHIKVNFRDKQNVFPVKPTKHNNNNNNNINEETHHHNAFGRDDKF